MSTHRTSPTYLLLIALVSFAGCEKSPSTGAFTVASPTAPSDDSPVKDGDGQSIRVLSGQLTYNEPNAISIEIKGTHGLRVSAVVPDPIAFFVPRLDCAPCEPGARVGLNAVFVDSSLSGTVKLRGQEYRLGMQPGDAVLNLEFTGEGVILPDVTGDSVELSAPFQFTGTVSLLESGGTTSHHAFTGQGVATLRFRLLGTTPDDDVWITTAAVYDFGH